MLAETTVEQFNEWIAMYRLEPWGDDWAQAGTIAAAVFNASGNIKEPRSPVEFIPGELERVKAANNAAEWAKKYAAK